ncbi:MAG: UDP-N-acetylmuramate dehydrogenase [Eubacteriaceae bacterium]|nr:UDP-N-acetylmuramate dehydrogenase [Eubacteriaceae bacterium]
MITNYIYDTLASLLGPDSVFTHVPMAEHTSFKTGGHADTLVLPHSEKDVQAITELCAKNSIPYYIMGRGSNLLVRDKGYRGVIIKMSENYSTCKVIGNTLVSESGISLYKLSLIALENSLGGFEFASGIPGTLGGAVAMNAGAYDGEMKDVLFSATVLDKSGKIYELTNEELQLGYRTSIVHTDGLVVLTAKISLFPKDYLVIKSRMDELDERRSSRQPLELPSAGSTFKRPAGHFAGKLIEDSGLKGYSLGGAQVSEKHCGFVVNKNNATASDIISLIEHVKKTVKEKFGVDLEPEVKIIGEE